VRELESRMESLQMEVEDFKSAVKLQSVAMDKFHQARSEEVHKFNNFYIINKYLLGPVLHTWFRGSFFICDDCTVFRLMFNLFFFIIGLSCPRSVQTSLTQNLLGL
jgi:hypothetical protein